MSSELSTSPIPKIIEVEKTGRWLYGEQTFLIDVCGHYIKTGPKSVITCSFCGCRIAGLFSYQIPERCPNCHTKMVNCNEINNM